MKNASAYVASGRIRREARMRFFPFCFAFLLALPAARADLATDAYQILEKNCQMCHGAAVQMSGLDLRTREKALVGGERGAAIEPTNLESSFLWRFVTHEQKPEMPPGSKLDDKDIETLRKWILAGAPFPLQAARAHAPRARARCQPQGQGENDAGSPRLRNRGLRRRCG